MSLFDEIQSNPDKIYTKTLTLGSSVSLTELISETSYLASDHLAACGLTKDVLNENHLAWFLVNNDVHIKRFPRPGEHIVLYGWQGPEHLLIYPRTAMVYSESGEELMSAASFWIPVDTTTRTMLARPVIAERVPTLVLEGEPKKPLFLVKVPGTLPLDATRTVTEEMIDFNGHMNNAFYIGWALDLLEECRPKDAPLYPESLMIEYSKELKLGETVRIIYGFTDGAFVVRGFSSEVKAFTIKMAFA